MALLFLQKLILRFVQGSYENYGLQKPDHDILEAHATVNSELLYFIKHGKIAPKVDIDSFNESSVVFKDGSNESYDYVMYATGYKITFPFLDQSIADYENNDVDLYDLCFHPDINNLMFVGLIQPLGCIWPLSDLQSQLIAKYLKGDWKPPIDLQRAIRNQKENKTFDFIDTPRHKLEVDYHEFAAHLQKEIQS